MRIDYNEEGEPIDRLNSLITILQDLQNEVAILSDELDKKDFIDEGYILEVSSPGLGRTLKKDRHLEKSIGEEVDVKTYKPIDKVKEFTGILEKFDENTITISEDGKERVFQRSEIAKISLTIDF